MLRRTPLALPLSTTTAGLKTVVNATWNGMTSFAVASGRARAKFLGTSSPRIIDSTVATSIATIVAIGPTAASGMLHATRVGPRRLESAGSIVYPVSSVVRVMPS